MTSMNNSHLSQLWMVEEKFVLFQKQFNDTPSDAQFIKGKQQTLPSQILMFF